MGQQESSSYNIAMTLWLLTAHKLGLHLEDLDLPGGLDGKESACHAGDSCWILGSGRSPGEGTGYPLQYSCLENSMDRGTWQAVVHGVKKKEWDTTEPLMLSPSGSLSQCLENLFYPPPRLVRLSEEPWEQTSLTAFPLTVSQSLSVWDCWMPLHAVLACDCLRTQASLKWKEDEH